ncbi:hypothetical protein BDF21DRAFT_260287 [Thamnidium elegans]|nr:hypothetical protein BDF21DRAFT_260287 [Thamnidium elegans]
MQVILIHSANIFLNNSAKSSTGVTWSETIQTTPDNITLINTINIASRITNEPVTMILITINPGILLQHMYQMLLYFEIVNNDNIRTFNQVQKQVLSRNDLFKVLNRKKKETGCHSWLLYL